MSIPKIFKRQGEEHHFLSCLKLGSTGNGVLCRKIRRRGEYRTPQWPGAGAVQLLPFSSGRSHLTERHK